LSLRRSSGSLAERAGAMRLVFLIPDLGRGFFPRHLDFLLWRLPDDVGRWLLHRYWVVETTWGGTLNCLRQCEVARRAGLEAVMATTSGRDNYADVLGPGRRLPFIAWRDRQPGDICIVPDYASRLTDDVRGPVIVYQQSPLQLKNDFDFARPDVSIWTDSPFMLEKCHALFPGKDIPIVPNIVDESLFPFVPQHERKQGLLFAFPRKNPEFIEATWRSYVARGGRYWKLELIDGLSIRKLAERFLEPQAFLASAREEGCALPPQECMAAGIVVVGRSASGANFSMQDGVTSLIAETPESAADRLFEAESPALRQRLSEAGREYISRYFPAAEPLAFWNDQRRQIASSVVGAHGSRVC
jgi:glycosyltransferase involved in cell wall biosynthesis